MTTHKKFAAGGPLVWTDAASPSVLLRLSSAATMCDASRGRDKRHRLAKPNRSFSAELHRPTKSMRIGNVHTSVVALPASLYDKADAMHAHGRIGASPQEADASPEAAEASPEEAAEAALCSVATSSGFCAVAADPLPSRVASNRAASAVARGCTPLAARDDVGDAFSVLFLNHGVFGRRKYSRVLFLPVIPVVPAVPLATGATAATRATGATGSTTAARATRATGAATGATAATGASAVGDEACRVGGSCWHARKYLYNLGSRYHRG